MNPGARVMNVSSADDVLVVEIEDGRAISVPLLLAKTVACVSKGA